MDEASQDTQSANNTQSVASEHEARGTWRFLVKYKDSRVAREVIDFCVSMTAAEAEANRANWQALKRYWHHGAVVLAERVA